MGKNYLHEWMQDNLDDEFDFEPIPSNKKVNVTNEKNNRNNKKEGYRRNARFKESLRWEQDT